MKTNSSLLRIPMNTGLKGFSLLSRISAFSEETVSASADLQDLPSCLGLELLAQAGAYHVRFLCGFERQAVLLMIKECRLPAGEKLNGRYDLAGRLRSRSASAFGYEMTAEKNGAEAFGGDFVFAAAPYDSVFRKEIFKGYYEKKWENFLNG